MEDMTVQTATDSTESLAVATDCEDTAQADVIPTQDTLSSDSANAPSSLTDDDGLEAKTKTDGEQAEMRTFMPVYKGKVYPMAASDTQEITTLLQLGMKQREMQPIMDDLQRLAIAHGSKSIKEFVECAKGESDAQALAAAVEAYGEQEGRAYFEAQQERLRQSVEPPADEQVLLSERLAAEFCALRKEFPEYAAIGQLPREVLHTAMTESVSLTDALLRYQHRQAKRTQTEKRSAARSAASATGSLRQSVDTYSSTAMDAFLRGLHRRL